MLNRAYDAAECLRVGIVDQVHPAAALGEAVDKLARELARGPTAAFGRIRTLCDRANELDLEDHLKLEREMVLMSARSRDFREGLRAFVEKRAPDFAGT